MKRIIIVAAISAAITGLAVYGVVSAQTFQQTQSRTKACTEAFLLVGIVNDLVDVASDGEPTEWPDYLITDRMREQLQLRATVAQIAMTDQYLATQTPCFHWGN